VTIGIVVKFKEPDGADEGFVILADRMVSFGAKGVEYPVSKIDELTCPANPFRLFAVASGAAPLIDEFFSRIKRKLAAAPTRTVEDATQDALGIADEMLKEDIEMQLLKPWGLSTRDFTGANPVNPQLMERLMTGAMGEVIPTFWSMLQVTFGGIDHEGVKIMGLAGGDLFHASKIGFGVTGSGEDSAEWTLIHGRFDPKGGLFHSLLLAVMAKVQAEESMGVGRSTNAHVVRLDRAHDATISEDAISKIRDWAREEEKRRGEEVGRFISGMGSLVGGNK
jgi:hypothetical protein